MRGIPDARTNPCPQCGGTYWAIKPPPGLPSGTGKLHSPLEPTDWTTSMKVLGLSAAAILLAALFLLAMAYRAHAQTFRDASGREIGTATRSSNGTTTFRDGAGRMTGTASTNSNGTTTFRDGSGRMTGTAERRR
jgi:YD repeat-containing protein